MTNSRCWVANRIATELKYPSVGIKLVQNREIACYRLKMSKSTRNKPDVARRDGRACAAIRRGVHRRGNANLEVGSSSSAGFSDP